MNKRCKNMGSLLLLLFTVTSVYCLVGPHCEVPGESNQRVNSPAVCQSGCEEGWYGDHCRRKCPEFCLKCDRVTGHCFRQCKDGYFGTHCSLPCPHCNLTCDAEGHCINEGTIRNPKTPISTIINAAGSTKLSSDFGKGVGCGIGITIIIGMFVISIYCCYRNRKNNSSSTFSIVFFQIGNCFYHRKTMKVSKQESNCTRKPACSSEYILEVTANSNDDDTVYLCN